MLALIGVKETNNNFVTGEIRDIIAFIERERKIEFDMAVLGPKKNQMCMQAANRKET